MTALLLKEHDGSRVLLSERKWRGEEEEEEE